MHLREYEKNKVKKIRQPESRRIILNGQVDYHLPFNTHIIETVKYFV